MLSDAELQVWAPGSVTAEIRRIEQGIVALIEQQSGRSFTSPVARVEWDFNVAQPPSGGLSGYAPGELQRLYLPEIPNVTLTGTVTVAANGTAVTGSGTAFLSELDGFAADKTSVTIEDERLLVSAVASDTALTLTSTTPHVAGATAKAIKADVIWLKTRSPGGITWTAADGRYIQTYGRVLESGAAILPTGDHTVRTRVNFGWAEDAGPADVMLLIGEMVQEWNRRQSGQGAVSRVSKSGSTVTWASMGSRTKEFYSRARGLRYAMRFAA